jgi:hypothetical protein
MTVGAMTLTCLLLAAGQVPSDLVALNQTKVRFPLNINLARRQEISQIKLYVSSDRGLSWQQEAVVAPDQDAVYFYAPRDGEYWLQVATVSRNGKQEPDNIYRVPPGRIAKVLIDTLKPLVRITAAQRQADEIAVAWEIQEDHPDPASLKLEYQTAGSSALTWTPAAAPAALIGQARIYVPVPQAVRLRLQMKDRAGNLSVAEAEVAGLGGITPTAFMPAGQTAALTTPPAPGLVTPPGPPPAPAAAAAQPAPAPPAAPPVDKAWAGVPPPPPGAGQAEPPAPQRSEATPRVVASSDALPPPAAAPAAPPAVEAAAKQLPQLQVVNTKIVTMKYQLDKIGPSGVGAVELWLTPDDGATWMPFADDPKAEVKAPGATIERTVELPGEGVYGFRLVVKSKAGLGDPPPRAGDLPEMRVEVDLTPPLAKLYEPVPDPQHPNTLLFTWKCEDKNLAQSAVTLEWAERRDGTWQVIAAGLPSQPSQYSWQLPATMPVHVYLRMRVRDNAGNEQVVVTAEPQLVDLAKPVGRLVSISATPRH